jgi:hypothetical protein
MSDEAKSQQLQEAVKKAVLDMLAHEHFGLAGFTFPLNDKLSVTVGQTRFITDSVRFSLMEEHGVSVKTGLMGRAARWVASYDVNGFSHLFAGPTARDAVDLAIAELQKPP